MSERDTTVLIVDDQPVFVDAAAAVVAATPGFTVAGTAGDAAEVRHRLARIGDTDPGAELPDLVLMDVHLGEDDGVELTAELMSQNPTLRIVLVSTMAADDLAGSVSACGAAGYVPKRGFGPAALQRVWAEVGGGRGPAPGSTSTMNP